MAQAKKSKRATPLPGDYRVVLGPVITEKSSLVGGDGSRYVFKVDPRSSKTQIRAAIERVFDVDVASIQTCRYMGKVKRTTRATGRRAQYKKAYVELRSGQSISIVEGL